MESADQYFITSAHCQYLLSKQNNNNNYYYQHNYCCGCCVVHIDYMKYKPIYDAHFWPFVYSIFAEGDMSKKINLAVTSH